MLLRLSTRLLAPRLPALSPPPASASVRTTPPMPKTVLLGGGNAAGYFASELDACGAAHVLKELTIVTDEAVRFWMAGEGGEGGGGCPHGAVSDRVLPPQVTSYERPALSKAFLAPANPARLPGFHTCVGGGGARLEAGWYKEKGVDYRTGARATAVDTAAKTVTLADGSSLPYDTLVVATGARSVDLAADFKVPGADAGGIHYLRNVADGDALYAAIKAAADAHAPVVVVGGGYIGVEVTGMLTLWGIQPTVVFPEDRVLARQLSPASAAFYQAFFTAKGAVFKPGVSATAFDVGADGRVAGVQLSDGTALPAALVIVGAGARPATDLLRGTSVALVDGPPGGVAVDGALRSTSDPSVMAIGDVAAFPAPGGGVERHEHVAHARASARHAARVLAGAAGGDYAYAPFFYSRADAYGLAWTHHGAVTPVAVEWGDRDAAAAAAGAKAVFGTFYLDAGGRVVGAFLEGGAPEDTAAMAAVVKAAPVATPDELAGRGLLFARAFAKM